MIFGGGFSLRAIALVFSVLMLAGCASIPDSSPKPPEGPTAQISEHSIPKSGSKGQLFYLAAIDGVQIKSGMDESRRATRNQGFTVSLRTLDHTVPARALRLKLAGTHMTGAPIHEMAARAAGTFFRVEGEITFTPEAGRHYFVTGILSKEGSGLWLADATTEKRVSEAIGYLPAGK